MAYKMRRVFCLMFCLVMGFTAGCDALWNLVLDEKPAGDSGTKVLKETLLPSAVKSPLVITEKENEKLCVEYVESIPSVVSVKYPDPKTLSIEVASNKVYDEASLIKWVMEFSTELFDTRACQWDQLLFMTSFDEGSYDQGVSGRSDYLLYKKGRISSPEWNKRFEIKKMNSIKTLKLQLKAERALGHHAKAFDLMLELFKTEDADVTLSIVKNNILLDQKIYHEAIAGYEALLASDPENITVLYNLAFAKKEIGSFADAIQIYQNLKTIFEQNPGSRSPVSSEDTAFQLADAYLKNNQLKETRSVLEKIKDKDSGTYHILLSNLLRQEGQYTEAKTILDGLIKKGAGTELALFNRTLLYLDLKDVEGARRSYEELKALNAVMAGELAFLPLFNERRQDLKDDKGPVVPEGDVIDMQVITPDGFIDEEKYKPVAPGQGADFEDAEDEPEGQGGKGLF
ncbi:MAG: tetratricopeptide repeat protein [Deltaproteobacteria bacterium]|nr:tetratricopeptide repeat protein [Deltaproteobacteria bacterium]